MKRQPIDPDLLRDRLAAEQGKQLWRSLDELAGDPAVTAMLQREFPDGASDLTDPVSRRRFLMLMGASLALAGATGCRPPQGRLVPSVRDPLQQILGKSLFYATSMTRIGAGPNEVVAGKIETCLQCDELLSVLLHQLSDWNACRVSCLHILDTVLVGTCLKPDAISLLAIKAGERVCLHHLQRKTYVRCGVYVRDRRRDVTVRARGTTGLFDRHIGNSSGGRGGSRTRKSRPGWKRLWRVV